MAVAIVCGYVQWPADLTARAAGGSVDGHVTIVTRPSRRLSSAGAYPGRTVTVGPSAGGTELANVIVFVDLPEGETSAPTQVAIRQTNEVFVPRVAAVTTGSTVDFPNDDPIFHNVFSLSRAAAFDLGRYPRGESKSRRFDKPGVVKVFCHLHSHMTAPRAGLRPSLLRAARRRRPLRHRPRAARAPPGHRLARARG